MDTGSGSRTRPNFFDLLDLDCSTPWDEDRYTTQLEKRQREWARLSGGVGKPAQDAKINLGLINEIARVMNKPALREEEAEWCRAGRREKRDALGRVVEAAKQDGPIYESKVRFWAREFRLSEDEVRQVVGGPILPDPPSATGPSPAGLDPSLAKNIRDRLDALGLNDLYALLGLPAEATTPTAALREAANNLYKKIQANSNKTAEVTLRSELAGLAMDAFRDEAQRERYDATCRREALARLAHGYELITGGARISDRLVEKYLADARREGFSFDEAIGELEVVARKNKWGVIPVPGDVLKRIEQQVRCPFCTALHDPAEKNCPACGKPFLLDCPNCHEKDIPVERPACPKCGFRTGERDYVGWLIEQMRGEIRDGEWLDAGAHLDEANRLWSPSTPDALARALAELGAPIRERREEALARQRAQDDARAALEEKIARQVGAIERAANARDYLRAQRMLADIPLDHPSRRALERRIEDGLRPALQRMQQAEAPGTLAETQARLYLEALDACADFAPAREALKPIQPPAPSGLSAVVSGSAVTLRWTPTAAHRITYTVVRKSGSPPDTLHDGEPVAERLTSATCDDHPAPVGEALYYAVFAVRERVLTPSPPAHCLEPVLVVQDVSDVEVRVDAHVVALTWTPPPHAEIVVVRTEDTPPHSPDDGVRLPPGRPTGLSDPGVRTHAIYYYGVYCHFALDRWSSGVVVRAIPQRPPAFPGPLAITKTPNALLGCTVELAWPVAAAGGQKGRAGGRDEDIGAGRRVVLKCDRPGSFARGKVFKEREVAASARILEVAEGRARDAFVLPEEVYYVPAVHFLDSYYCGDPQPCIYVPDVRDLSAESVPDGAKLRWTWPRGCDEAIVAADPRAWPADPALAPGHIVVNRRVYERQDSAFLPIHDDGELFVVVATCARKGTRVLLATGSRLRVHALERARIDYQISPPSRWARKGHYTLTVRVRARHPIDRLPTLVVRYRQGSAPENASQGEEWQRLVGLDPSHPPLTIELPARIFPPDTYAAVFAEPAPGDAPVELIPPSPRGAKIN